MTYRTSPSQSMCVTVDFVHTLITLGEVGSETSPIQSVGNENDPEPRSARLTINPSQRSVAAGGTKQLERAAPTDVGTASRSRLDGAASRTIARLVL